MPLIPAGTTQPARISGIDAGGEPFSTKLFLAVITAGNAVAQAALWATFLSAWDALFLGARTSDLYGDETTYAVARPTNGAARELSLKIVARDPSTGQTWNYYFPTVNPALIEYIPDYGARDIVDVSTPEVDAFIDALTAMPMKNPLNYANNMVVAGVTVQRGQK